MNLRVRLFLPLRGVNTFYSAQYMRWLHPLPRTAAPADRLRYAMMASVWLLTSATRQVDGSQRHF